MKPHRSLLHANTDRIADLAARGYFSQGVGLVVADVRARKTGVWSYVTLTYVEADALETYLRRRIRDADRRNHLLDNLSISLRWYDPEREGLFLWLADESDTHLDRLELAADSKPATFFRFN